MKILRILASLALGIFLIAATTYQFTYSGAQIKAFYDWLNIVTATISTTEALLLNGHTALQEEPSEGGFVAGDKSKLDGIESNATADQTGAEIKTAYENEADTNAYTNSEKIAVGMIIPDSTFTQANTFIVGTGAGTYAETPIGTIEGGSSPTSDSNKIVHDYTAAQLVYGISGIYTSSPWEQQDFTFENLAAADDNYRFFTAVEPVTVLAIGVYCRGTCTTPAQISLEDGAGNAMTHTTPTAATGTDAVTFQSITAEGGLTKGEGLALDVDNAVSPETDVYTITIKYRYDRQ
jgi:hypothetical protein